MEENPKDLKIKAKILLIFISQQNDHYKKGNKNDSNVVY